MHVIPEIQIQTEREFFLTAEVVQRPIPEVVLHKAQKAELLKHMIQVPEELVPTIHIVLKNPADPMVIHTQGVIREEAIRVVKEAVHREHLTVLLLEIMEVQDQVAILQVLRPVVLIILLAVHQEVRGILQEVVVLHQEEVIHLVHQVVVVHPLVVVAEVAVDRLPVVEVQEDQDKIFV